MELQVKDIIWPPDRRSAVQAELREVVRDHDGKPHVFLRVKLSGWYFRHGAYDYALLIGDVVSRVAHLTPDGLTLCAYFDRPIPAVRKVTVVYGNVALEEFPLALEDGAVPRLDRKRLPRGVVDRFN